MTSLGAASMLHGITREGGLARWMAILSSAFLAHAAQAQPISATCFEAMLAASLDVLSEQYPEASLNVYRGTREGERWPDAIITMGSADAADPAFTPVFLNKLSTSCGYGRCLAVLGWSRPTRGAPDRDLVRVEAVLPDARTDSAGCEVIVRKWQAPFRPVR